MCYKKIEYKKKEMKRKLFENISLHEINDVVGKKNIELNRNK